ncbi:protein FAR1-RELATED SEQUENCE 5-like [Carex rostrata]
MGDEMEMETDFIREDDTNKKSANDHAPWKGMAFASLEEFENFYYNYAISEGYTVRVRRTTKFAHTDKICYRQYVCSCAGFCEEKSNDVVVLDQEKKSRKTLTRRSGCPVYISVSNKNGIWKVGKSRKEHNHLLVSPNSRIYLKQPGGMPSVAKSLVEKFSETDLPIGRVPDIVNCDASMNVSQRDCWNHRRDLRRKNLDNGDAHAVVQYCIEKKSQDPNFFYEIQTDEEDRMINFFWIDSTARQYYERFGDVLVFDTTYKTNKYSLPLGNFVGVNNHTQSIMFGFVLLQNEQEETFVWLFETWLNAMGGKLPISILTDQDRAIENAIRKVFPTVSHRFCLWHIMNKFSEKYGSLYKDNSPFSREMKNCLYHSITTEQFDNEWKRIMKDYKLMEDEWLNNLFDIRQSWIPIYNRTIFYAGMNTTQRCESIHSFFDSFLNKGTTLREFVVKYEHALEHRYRAEHAERFTSIYKTPILKLKSPLEEQAADVYTRKIFSSFQDELMECPKLKKKKLEKSGSSSKYKVSSFHNTKDAFIVTLDVEAWEHVETWEVSCECHLFEFKEKQKVASVAPSKKSDEGATQKETEAIQRETSPIETGNKQVDDTFTPSRRSDRVVTQNSTRGNERETLATKPGAKQVDGDFTPSKKSDKGANQAETSPAKKGARQADGTCTSASKNDIAGVKRNHICEENQQSPTKACGNHERKQVRSKENGKGTLRNANDASTSHANNTNVKMNNRFSHVPVHKFMDRNSSAHTFEWNDSIDDAPKMENAQTVMQSKRTQQIQNQKGQIPKRRRVLRWQPHEEEALRKAVKEIGKGNWKEILDTYPDEFTGRTAVDLKDKWRNMTRY